MSKMKVLAAAAIGVAMLEGCRYPGEPDLPPAETCWSETVKLQTKDLMTTFAVDRLYEISKSTATADRPSMSKDDLAKRLTVTPGSYYLKDRSASARSATCGASVSFQFKMGDGGIKSSHGDIVLFEVYDGEGGPTATMVGAEVGLLIQNLVMSQ